jgi:hypothetical protein
MVKMRAVVDWIPKDQGGRNRPPTGLSSPPYSTAVRFADAEEPWPPPMAWSLVVERDEALSEPCRWIADVHFLVDEAPQDSLRPGREFELYEGNRCVARGKILGDSMQVSDRADGVSSSKPQPPEGRIIAAPAPAP